MAEVRRFKTHIVGTVDVPAQAAWELLTDWAALLRWLPKGSFDLVRCDLEGGFTEIPRGRAMWTSAGVFIRETLLHQDDLARRIYYNQDTDGIPGVRNYLATTVIDELGPKKCQMEFSSNFDVIDPAIDGEKCRLYVESVHRDYILTGFAAYFREHR